MSAVSRIVSNLIMALSICVILAACIYTGGWYYLAWQIDHETRRILDQTAQQNNLKIDGTLGFPSGFPYEYHMTFSGDLVHADYTISIPELTMRGLPFPGEEVFVNASMGIDIDSAALHPDLRLLERASMSFINPDSLPPQATRENMTRWHENGHARLELTGLNLHWPDASIYGRGVLTFNEELQPELDAQVGVVNVTYFLGVVFDTYPLSESERGMLVTFVNALNTTGGAITAPLRIENQTFYVGMLRMADLPRIRWPSNFQEASD